MNIVLWTLQVLLALHTAMGAIWKFSNTAEQTMPSLKAIPHWTWLTLAAVELLCVLALVSPLMRGFFGERSVKAVPIAALFIAFVMVVYIIMHFLSTPGSYGPIIYWFIVAAVSLFIAYGRTTLRPL